MIAESIIKAIANEVYKLGFVSTSGAMIREIRTENGYRPSALIAPFDNPELQNIGPSENDSCVTMFAVGATQVTRQDTNTMRLRNRCRLIGWLNFNRLAIPDNADAELSVIRAVRNLRISVQEDSPVRMVDISLELSTPEAQEISRYGWDDIGYQFNAYPYQFFSHEFSIDYVVASRECCGGEIQIAASKC